MVGAPGLEPGTSSLSEKRSNQLSYAPETFQEPSPKAFGFGNFYIFTIGGAEGIRTHDILLAKQALYQLSYGQPLVPQRLPCYDFIPVTNRSLGASLHCWLSQRLRVQSAPMM